MARILPDLAGARPATPSDLAAVTDLLLAVDVATIGEPDWTEADQRAEWARPRVDLALDTLVVPGPGDRLDGYASVWAREPGRDYDVEVFVRPGTPEAVEDALFAYGEARAAETAGPGAVVHSGALASETGRAALLDRRGYRLVRHFFRMLLPLDAPRPAPAAPEVRGYRPEDERAVYEVVEAAFRDHFRSTSRSFEDWRARHVERPDHDPALWSVAERDGEVVGAAVCRDFGGAGWVDVLGVRADARGHGLGRALLERSFAGFAARGLARAELGVDAENATGATHLYESAGMTVRFRFDFYAKALCHAE